MSTQRHYSILDQILIQTDSILRTIAGSAQTATRPNPANEITESPLSSVEKEKSIALMRVNHAGEVAAQALYQGQALMTKSAKLKENFSQAAREENDHLEWCRTRIESLGGHVSYLNPLWYIGSLSIGMFAGLAGDKISLGFLAETEHQVTRHIDEHLQILPTNDEKSRAILLQMRTDEIQHATHAMDQGAAELPVPVKFVMGLVAKTMTITAYWV